MVQFSRFAPSINECMIYSFTNKLTYEITSKISSKVLDEMEEYCDSLNYKKQRLNFRE